MKTRQDNDVIDYIGAVYTENDTKLSWLIGPGADYDENQIRHNVINHTDMVYVENETQVSSPIGPGVVFDKN